jgi:hypothetical protein
MSLVSHLQSPTSVAHKLDHGDSNQFYYNARIANDDPLVAIPAEYIDNRPTPILHKPDSYNMAVVRFEIPTASIPIRNWKDHLQPGDDINKADRVSVVYEPTGDEYTENLVYVANGDKTRADGDPFGPIFVYGQYLKMINNAYELAFAALKAAHPGATQTQPPFVLYDAPTKLFAWYVPQNYSNIPLEIVTPYTTYSVSRYFGDLAGNSPTSAPGFQTPSALQFRFQGQDLKFNRLTIDAHDYYKMEQDVSTLARWNGIRSIVFDTTSIPIDGELLSSTPPAERLALAQSGQERGSNQLGFSFTDFEPIRALADRQAIQFFPQGPLRWYPLVGRFPMTTLSFSVSVTFQDGSKKRLMLLDGDVLTCKIEFRAKHLNLT